MPRIDFDEAGHEIPDSRPVALPTGFKKPESLHAQIQRLVRTHISREAQEQGMETFDEADDFDVDDDFDPHTPYEMEFDPMLGREVSPDMVNRSPERFRDEYLARAVDSADAEAHAKREQKRFRWPFSRSKQTKSRNEGGEPGGSHKGDDPPDSTPADGH